MRVLVVHNHWYEKGGEDEVVNFEAELLKGHGHEVVMYARSNEELKNFSFMSKLRFLANYALWSEKTYNEIKKIIKHKKPDIAHVHNTFIMVSPSVYQALKEENIPIVQSLCSYRLFCPRGMFYRDGRVCQECSRGNFLPAIIHKCWKKSFVHTFALTRIVSHYYKNYLFGDKIDAYMALSDFSRSKFIELGLPEDKVFVKPCCTDLNLDRENNAEDYALFIGRLIDYKGVNTLIEAYEKYIDSNLKIIGDGPLYEAIKRRIKGKGNIELLGWRSRDEKMEYIRKSRFVVFPSECPETFGIVIIEAFACGKPVIASRLGTRIELVKEGCTGLLFTPGDAKDLANKISWAWDNPEDMLRMGKEAQRECAQKYTADENYQALIDIYNMVIKKSAKTDRLTTVNFK